MFFGGQNIFAHKQVKQNYSCIRIENLHTSDVSFPKSYLNDFVEDNIVDFEEDYHSSDNELMNIDLSFFSKFINSPFDFLLLSFYQYSSHGNIDKSSNYSCIILENLPPIFISKSALII
jgi:predicted restriction endonuclease